MYLLDYKHITLDFVLSDRVISWYAGMCASKDFVLSAFDIILSTFYLFFGAKYGNICHYVSDLIFENIFKEKKKGATPLKTTCL